MSRYFDALVGSIALTLVLVMIVGGLGYTFLSIMDIFRQSVTAGFITIGVFNFLIFALLVWEKRD